MTATDVERTTLRDRPAMILGALGIVSGLLSAVIGVERALPALQPVADVFLLHASLLPIGICFATALLVGLLLLSGRLGLSLLAFVITLYAWSGATHIAIRLQRNAGDDAHLVAASLAAGAFGAGVAHLGASAAVSRLRRPFSLALTVIVGAAFGLFFYFGERGMVDKRVLFMLWQPAVAFVIGLSAAAPASDQR